MLERIVRFIREELSRLQEAGSYVGEVVKVMGKNKVLVKVRSPFCFLFGVELRNFGVL